jgi:hypothetical protein
MGFLGQNDQKASEHIYDILGQTLSRAQSFTNNIGFALIFQYTPIKAYLLKLQSVYQSFFRVQVPISNT